MNRRCFLTGLGATALALGSQPARSHPAVYAVYAVAAVASYLGSRANPTNALIDHGIAGRGHAACRQGL